MDNTNISERHRQELLQLCEQVRASGTIEPHQVAQLENFISSVKYGLRFERHEERVDRELRDNFPVLTDYKDKEICCKLGDKFNFLIEGDNLHSLKLLEKTHKGSIDVIYIDPPYNTGNEFVYNDKIVAKDDGYRHSKWLSFMKERLSIAHSLLKKEGIIFISIDDKEMANLKLLCDSIFGEENRLGIITVVNNLKGRSDDKFFATAAEFLLVYAKDITAATIYGFEMDEEQSSEYKFQDEIGRYKLVGLKKTGKNCYKEDRPNMYYPIYFDETTSSLSLENNDGAIEILPKINGRDGRWRWGKETFLKNAETELVCKKTKDDYVIYVKMRDTVNGESRKIRPKTLWLNPKYDSGSGTKCIKDMFGENVFTNPKPIEYIKDILRVSTKANSIVLDFFAGSGTTGHAVVELNDEDGGNRKFILCTNNENNICENITYQRLKTVITGIRQDGSRYSDGIPANLKYFQCDLIHKSTEDVDDILMEKAMELIELENYIDISDPSIAIIYDEEDLDDLIADFDERIKHIYVSSDVATTGEQEIFLIAHKVQLTEIPHHYYKEV